MYIEIHPAAFPPDIQPLALEAAHLVNLVTGHALDPDTGSVEGPLEPSGSDLLARAVVDLVDGLYEEPTEDVRDGLRSVLHAALQHLMRDARPTGEGRVPVPDSRLRSPAAGR